MAMLDFVKRTARGAAVAGALVGAAALTAPTPAHAISNGAAVGLGLGALALGTALGAGAYPGGYYAPYGYYPQGYYYPPAPAYYPPAPRTCWDPYYRRYYAC
jgi:hypothetical protein